MGLEIGEKKIQSALSGNRQLYGYDVANHAKHKVETEVGRQGVALAKPRSIADLTALNSIIRLMAPEKGMETPLQKFAKFKDDHSLWEREMDEYGLTEHEKEIIRRHLTSSHGICESQEGLMSLVQESEIAGWSLKKADGLRKSIAKFLAFNKEIY